MSPPMAAEQPPFLWSDLLAHRTALALLQHELHDVLRIGGTKYWERERGARPVGTELVGELLAMEALVGSITEEAVAAAAAAAGASVLTALMDQSAFDAAYPNARTQRDAVVYPVSLQHVAIGRAAAELSRGGFAVEVYRGRRRADLMTRRLAVGLRKRNDAAELLGVDAKKYHAWEIEKNPPAGLLAELQAIDDFIEDAAAHLEVKSVAGVEVVPMLDEQSQFERMYPRARTLRGETAYPVLVHRVAAARRAQAIAAAGGTPRIGVVAD
ncbi:hypothetical protein [Mycobacteroides abscessus]|uniref:hypothetical protein n=2 Tax=Mycobacteroides abscessus TaxID=36809 RepID=UPI0009412A3E|nr:hypothetical protein [Mycobacteroides abscessus]